MSTSYTKYENEDVDLSKTNTLADQIFASAEEKAIIKEKEMKEQEEQRKKDIIDKCKKTNDSLVKYLLENLEDRIVNEKLNDDKHEWIQIDRIQIMSSTYGWIMVRKYPPLIHNEYLNIKLLKDSLESKGFICKIVIDDEIRYSRGKRFKSGKVCRIYIKNSSYIPPPESQSKCSIM